MRRTSIIFIYFLIATGLRSQIAYYDALRLYKFGKIDPVEHSFIFGQDKKDSIFTILRRYAPPNITDAELYSYYTSSTTNPFFYDFFGGITKDAFSFKDLGGSLKSAASFAGGIDITNIADGFAKFIVKRTKEELNLTFFANFKTCLSKPEYKDIQTLFPQTYRTLSALGDEVYNYERYLVALRECFEKDLSNLLSNAPKIRENHAELFRQQPRLDALLTSAFYFMEQVQAKRHPADILAGYPDKAWKNTDPSYQGSVQLVKIISGSLRSRNKTGWISASELKEMHSKNEAFIIYLGLIYQQVKDSGATFGKTNMEELMRTNADAIRKDVSGYKNYISGLTDKTDKLQEKLTALAEIKNDSLRLEEYYSFFNLTIDLFAYAVTAEKLPGFPVIGLQARSERYTDAARTAADLVVDIYRKNYTAGIMNVFVLYSDVFAKDTLQPVLVRMEKQVDSLHSICKALEKDQEKGKEGMKSGDLTGSRKKYEQLKNEYERSKNMQAVFRLVLTYGTFMAEVAQAKSSDEVAAAIEVFALPSGSSRIKRVSRFNTSINSYVGLYGGGEQILNYDRKAVFTGGLSVPVGVCTSWGFGKSSTRGSFSILLSAVDLGAIASFRFSNDSVSRVPVIQLKDIVSPGLFFSIGLPNCPVSLNLGGQIGPNLRNVTSAGNTYSDHLYWRLSAGLYVDIPLLNLHTSSRDFN